MSLSNQVLEQFAEERAAIVKSGHLHWVHWVVILLSLVLTVGAWQFAKRQIDEKTSNQFERSADQVVELISERMLKYEDALWGGVSAIQMQDGRISDGEWRVFADSLRIGLKYPGISGIGVIHHVLPKDLEAYLEDQRRTRPDYNIHPAHDSGEYLPITHIEPARENAKAVGLDMAHEANRYSAALKARDTGSAQITGPIVLVQDQGATPGFLFYAPYYSGGIYESVQDRRDNFLGMVYAPFVVHKLMEGVLEKAKRQVRIRISDAEDILYDEKASDEQKDNQNPLFATTVNISLYGRTWKFDIWATKSFQASHTNDQPLAILFGGLIIDSLLFALFIFLSRANRRAVSFADRTTNHLKANAEALQRSNMELEKFAYVTSHDLKTPLRGIGDLAEYLEEDLQAYMQDPGANPDVKKNVQRLHQQVQRMDGLIKGILEYSAIGPEAAQLAEVDSAGLISSLQSELGLRSDQLVLKGDFPVWTTDAVRFEQVLSNLLGNAKKYHHDPEQALITVSVEETGGFYVFSIADNGPGIDPRFHSRIFEVFQTLQSRDEIESTGIGLSIVKKAVEMYGGSIRIFSETGKGASFTVKWPKTIRKADTQSIAA